MSTQRRRSQHGRSAWAPRVALLSTLALLICFVSTGSTRATAAFLWVSMALVAMGLEFAARRRAAVPPPEAPAGPQRGQRARSRRT